MDYIITFSDVMAAILTLGVGAMGFFLKHWFDGVEQHSRETQEKIEQGKPCLIEHIKQEINDIKGDFATTFVLREDFFRSMNGVEDRIKSIDQKIDRLLLNTENNK